MSDLRHECAMTMTCCAFSVIRCERPSSETLGPSVMRVRVLNTQFRLCRGGSFEQPSLPYTSTERSAASMRQPTRPFITAYKGRSPKSRISNPWKIKEAENAAGSISLKDPSAAAAVDVERDATYLAALDAADAVFGGRAAEHSQIPPEPNGHRGRVLPNLLEADVINDPPARGASTRTRRVRQPAKVAKAVPAEPKKVKPQPAVAPPNLTLQRAKEPEPEVILKTSSRAIRTIRRKWVLKTELKAGESWKRRLSKFAR
ncbi:hypothetical protein [Methylocystis sp.]|uniref:hypothetical protein n=1 Tax=Methylocystis sp. TaxID=1911079 RepID=UPI003DA28C8F